MNYLKLIGLCLIFVFIFGNEANSAVKYKKYRDIYLQRRLAHAMPFVEGKDFSIEYKEMDKELSEMYKSFMTGKHQENWDENLKKFVNEIKQEQ